MLIALDANIWISERLLLSATGAAFIHAVRSGQHKIMLAEVTRQEVLQGLARAGADAVKKIEDGFVTLQVLSGARPDYHLPDEESFRTRAESRFNELASLLIAVDADIAAYRRALSRVIEHRAPSATKEQYRDALLWELLVVSMGGADALLVSEDADFCDRKPLDGLAESLKREVGDKVQLVRSLADCLKCLVKDLPCLDHERFLRPIRDRISQEGEETAQRDHYKLGELTDSKLEFYATEAVGSLAVVFELTFSVDELPLYDGTTATDALLIFSGDCRVGDEDLKLSSFHMASIEAFHRNGSRIPYGVQYMQGFAAAGRGVRSLPYSVKSLITPSGT